MNLNRTTTIGIKIIAALKPPVEKIGAANK